MNNEQRGVALLIVLMLLALRGCSGSRHDAQFSQPVSANLPGKTIICNGNMILNWRRNLRCQPHPDVKDNDRQTTLQQYWAQPQQLQLEDGNTVKWQLRDAQHCFNLNALAKISDDPLASLISRPSIQCAAD